jgi:phage shock protein PspC (stress-responsive transcriptional regulator)
VGTGVIPDGSSGRAAYCRTMSSSNVPSWQLSGLSRPRDDRMIAGVAAGIARRFGLSPTTVRLLFILSLLLPGPQVLIYLALWVLIPDER